MSTFLKFIRYFFVFLMPPMSVMIVSLLVFYKKEFDKPSSKITVSDSLFRQGKLYTPLAISIGLTMIGLIPGIIYALAYNIQYDKNELD